MAFFAHAGFCFCIEDAFAKSACIAESGMNRIGETAFDILDYPDMKFWNFNPENREVRGMNCMISRINWLFGDKSLYIRDGIFAFDIG